MHSVQRLYGKHECGNQADEYLYSKLSNAVLAAGFIPGVLERWSGQ